jgi:hypothetical protein
MTIRRHAGSLALAACVVEHDDRSPLAHIRRRRIPREIGRPRQLRGGLDHGLRRPGMAQPLRVPTRDVVLRAFGLAAR